MTRILNISGSPVTDRGILKLAEYVEANLPDFTLIIGCKPFVYDVDAVLIGKGNIYAIECKDWKGEITGGTYGWWQKDSQVIENPLQQTRNNAAALGKWLRRKIPGKKIWMKSILLFTHEEGELHLNLDKASNSGVSVVQLNELKEWMNKQTSSFNDYLTSQVLTCFSSLTIEDKKQYSPVIIKTFFTLSLILLAVTVFFGYRFIFIDKDDGFFTVVFGILFAIVTIPLTELLNPEKVLVQKEVDDESQMVSDQNEPHTDLAGDPLPHVFYDAVTGKPYQNMKRSFNTALKNVEILKCPDCSYQKSRVKSKDDAGSCPSCNVKFIVFKGIQDFHFHDLRHTFASHLVMAGVDITTVKELLGHKTLTMTLRYSHLAPAHKVKAVDILDSTLNGTPTIQKLYNSIKKELTVVG